jgi:hypothetical protein
MKKFVLAGFTVFMFLVGSIGIIDQASADIKDRDVIIAFDIGRPKFDCKKGIWFCRTTIIINQRFTDMSMAQVQLLEEESKVRLIFKNPLAEEVLSNGYFFAEKGEEVTLPQEVSRKLGVSSITLLPGKYKIDPSTGKYGSVTVSVRWE